MVAVRIDLKEDQSRADWMRFHVFSTMNGRVELNQGLDLYLRLENLLITDACLSSREDRVVL